MTKKKDGKIEIRMDLAEKELIKIQSEFKNEKNVSEYIRKLVYEDLIKSGILTPREK